MGKMPSLKDVSREWEKCEEVRERIRSTKHLVTFEDPDDTKINIRNAAWNYHALKPIVRRLCDSTGDVGMHALPSIESQKLERIT